MSKRAREAEFEARRVAARIKDDSYLNCRQVFRAILELLRYAEELSRSPEHFAFEAHDADAFIWKASKVRTWEYDGEKTDG